MNATFISSKAYKVACEIDSDFELIFDFNGQQIRAPMSSFILEGTDGNCYLGILESPYAILGDNFLQNTYVVVDDYEISIAQARYSEEENIEIIFDSIPNASKAPNYYYTEIYEDITLTASISIKTRTVKSTTTISGGNNAIPTSKFSNYCEFYTVRNDNETCQDVIIKFNITNTDIEEFNKFTDMWFGCDFIMLGDTFCISSPNSLNIVNLATAINSDASLSIISLGSSTESRGRSESATSKLSGLAGTIQVSNLLTSILTILTYIFMV